MYNAAVGAPRVAAMPTKLGGYSIPQGAIVISDIYGLHHNEACAQDNTAQLDQTRQICLFRRLEGNLAFEGTVTSVVRAVARAFPMFK